MPAPCRCAVLACSAALSGCCSAAAPMPEPWVKPYERERLADPIMKLLSATRWPTKHREHVLDVREGARGATGVQGGGCGCN